MALELCRCYNISHDTIDQIDFLKSIYHYYEAMDFISIYKDHKKRYDTYVAFLQENGLVAQKPPFPDFYEKFNAVTRYSPIVPITTANK